MTERKFSWKNKTLREKYIAIVKNVFSFLAVVIFFTLCVIFLWFAVRILFEIKTAGVISNG